MASEKSHRELSAEQVQALTSNGCTAENWADVLVSDGFDPSGVRNAHFVGKVLIGSLFAAVESASGLEKPCGIYNATIVNCTIGDGCRIADVAVHLANYDIAADVCIENVATMQTNPQASFGNGVEIDVVNEAGGRGVVLFDLLSSQLAYITCLHRYRPKLIEKIEAVVAKYVKAVTSDRGSVRAGARICSVGEIIDVNIGESATVNGASSLVNGTILSSSEAPTIVGTAVSAKNFIIAESSSVIGGAILDKTFVGQGCRIGKQFSAENCLFFANCEGFHGEACSIFAGPYTVTHHKSTLLIAGLFSFYNAGSGTNQSNHMYKLGPVHEGKLLRGTKTGSCSYMMWPCGVGPFSVVLGKHAGTFDVRDFPFSHVATDLDGRCAMIPGLHLSTVGTIRDGEKWPARDNRKGSKRDVISFDVFSPYTIGKMFKASAILKDLREKTDKTQDEVIIGGARVKRTILHTGIKYYRTAIELYLMEKVVERIELDGSLAIEADSVYSNNWLDIGGQLMPQQRLADLEDAIESGAVSTVDDLAGEIKKIDQAYNRDQWAWVCDKYKNVFSLDLAGATKDELLNIVEAYCKAKTKFLNTVANDARKEFSELSRHGFGIDGGDADVDEDFRQVRGTYEENKFVSQIAGDVEKVQQRMELLKQKLSSP